MESKPLIIYGNGQMATMVAEFAKTQYEVAAFTVDAALITKKKLFDLPMVPFEELATHYSPKDYNMLIAVGFVEMNRIRADRYRQAKQQGFCFVNYIDRSVRWHESNQIGENNIILDQASIHPFCRLGNSNFISSNTNIGHGCVIGDNCWFNSGVSIGGETEVEDSCVLAMNASVTHGVKVGAKTFLGANAFLGKNSEPGSVYITEAGVRFRVGSEAFLKLMKVV